MDMMQIRKMVMAQMASGAQFIKGTITIGTGFDNYDLQFGKTFNKYFYYFEMTDASKTMLLNSGSTASDNMYAVCGVYERPKILNTESNIMSLRYSVKISQQTDSTSNSAIFSTMTNTSITLPCKASLTNRMVFYSGYTYNYYIVEIK